jgi:uncharacterized membrane protein (DUF441 family)
MNTSWSVCLPVVLATVVSLVAPVSAQTSGEDTNEQASASEQPPPPPPVYSLETRSSERSSDSSNPLDYQPEKDETFTTNPRVRRGVFKHVSLEFFGGLGGMLAGSLVGWIAGVGMEAVAADPDPARGPLVGTLVGVVSGTSLGVWLTGEGLRGDGNLLAVHAGTVVGAGLGATSLFLTESGSPTTAAGRVSLAIALPAIGGVVAYEISNTTPYAKQRKARAGMPAFAGFAPTDNGGGIFIVGGRW